MGALIKRVCDRWFDPVFVPVDGKGRYTAPRPLVGIDLCVDDLRRGVMLWVCS